MWDNTGDVLRRLAALERDARQPRAEPLISKAAAFASGPATGQLVFRTDLGWLCYYDGSRWLTAHEVAHPLTIWTTYTVNTNLDTVLRTDVAPYVTRVAIVTYVATTNTGAHYWSVALQGVNGSQTAATTVLAVTTAGDPVDTYTAHEGAAATPAPANRTYWRLALSKTGAPGTLYINAVVYYRSIVT